jgi:general secretion pathway protein C
MKAWLRQRGEFGQGLSLPLIMRLLKIAGLVLLGWLLIRAFILFFNPEIVWTARPEIPTSVAGNAAQSPQNFSFNTDPFAIGAVEQGDSKGSISFEEGFDAPETELNLVLKGRTVGNPGSAVLRTPDNLERSYRVGEDVMNGVSLQAVRPKFVVLDVRGELQRLTFIKDDTTGLVVVQESESPLISAPQTSNSTLSAAAVDASQLLKTVKFNPYYDQGRLSGYSVASATGDAGLKKFGLKSGDVITKVNTTSLVNERLNLLELAASLRNAKQVKMQIIRDGQSQTITIGR